MTLRIDMIMNKIEDTLQTLYFLEANSRQKLWINEIHPLSKLLTCIAYVGIVVSFPKYAFFPLLTMCCYPLLIMTLARLSFKACLYQLRILFVLVGMVGIFNPLFDRVLLFRIGPLSVTTGMLSLLTLMLKGIFSVLSSYLLLATTSIEEICFALKRLHLPNSFICILLLSYRHFILFLSELNQMLEAYHLRAVHQKGIHLKAWGSFTGHFLLRSIDRAHAIFESMTLRGFHGYLTLTPHYKSSSINLLYPFIWLPLFLMLRFLL